MINLLVEDLSVYLQKKLKEFSLETKKGRRSIKIFKYFLPTKKKETEDDFPLIIIRPFEGEDSKQSDATVKFICGVYSQDEEGIYDLISLMEKVRLALLEDYEINPKFRLEQTENKPLKWEISEDQPYPQWLGAITATFNVPIVQIKAFKGDIYGDSLYDR